LQGSDFGEILSGMERWDGSNGSNGSNGGVLTVLAPVADLVNHLPSKGGGARLRPRIRRLDQNRGGGGGVGEGRGGGGGGDGGRAAVPRAEEAGGVAAAEMWRMVGKQGVEKLPFELENLTFELVAGANYSRGQVFRV